MDQLLSSQPLEDSSPRPNTRRIPGGPHAPSGPVTDVRVERLDSEREAHNWALCPQCGGTGLYTAFAASGGALPDTDTDCDQCNTYTKRFHHLWSSVNEPESWDANPWLWVVEFRRIQP